jgi:tetratricopeptide (TPR) repeat protein
VLRAQLKLYLRPDWPTAGDDLAEALRRDPDDALANLYMGYFHGLLGHRDERTRWAARAVACDPLSPFVRGIAGMSYYCTREYDDALRLYDEGLALDPNTVVCLWQSAITLARLDRLDDALARIARAVDLSQRSSGMLAMQYMVLHRLGRTGDAEAIRDEMRARSLTQYTGAWPELTVAMCSGDEAVIAGELRHQLADGTGPTSLSCVVDVELEALIAHPRLGPLIRQLSLYAQNPRFNSGMNA